MKRILLKILPILLLICLFAFCLAACGEQQAQNPNGDVPQGQTPGGDNPGGQGSQGENPGDNQGNQGENPGGQGSQGGEEVHTHELTFHEAVEPNCKNDGNVAYWSCAGCGKNFSDEDGTKELKTVTVKAVPSAHVWGDWNFIEGNCNKNGIREHTCTICQKNVKENFVATGHDWTDWEGGNATCTEDGTQKRSCKVCHTEEETFSPALGHDWGAWKILTEPTCEAKGEREHTCTVCKLTAKQEMPALGHDYTFEKLTDPTQTTEGSEKGTCSVCGKDFTRVIPMTEAPTGIYRIVVSKTNGRYIPMWHKAKDGTNWRRDIDSPAGTIYTTEVTITKPDGEFVFRGNMVIRDENQKEVEPYIEVELPLGDYKISLGEIPEGYIYRDSYDLKKDQYIKIMPVKGTRDDTQSEDTRHTKETLATHPVDVYGKAVEAGERKLSGALTIVLTSEMSDGRLPSKTARSVDGYYGGIFRGAILPDFTLTTADGELVRLKDLLQEKKIVILDVYFILCPHCMAIAPGLVQFANYYKDDIAVICLDRDDTNANYAKQIYDPKGHYKYPEWFYCIVDYQTQFYNNIEHDATGVTAPTEVVIDDGFCVADVLATEHPITDVFRNLPDGFNRNYEEEIKEKDKAAASNTVSNFEFVLPERKRLFA